MAKKDAIFDYSSHFDTEPYLADISATWTTNIANATNVRHDRQWSGNPGATPGTALAGREAGMWKQLIVWDIANDPSYLTRDDGSKNKLDPTAVHRLIRNIKTTFNLPNPIDTATWPDQYLCAGGEKHYLWWQSKDRAKEPMALSYTGGGMINDEDSDNHHQCALFIPISGYSDSGLDDNTGSWTVRPTATNATTFKAHYQGLVDASTAAASYTDPSLVGSEFTQTGEIVLINLENQYRPTPQSYTEDVLTLIIVWSNKSYSDIKTLVDAAIA
jgi:hypothetical protein